MQHQFIHFYSLNYKQVGLVTARHNSIHDGVADLDRKSFTPTHVLDEPFIFAGCAGKRPKTNPVRYKATSSTPLLEATEQKDDLLIYNLFQNGTGSVNSMCIMNINAEFNLAKTPETFHQVAEWTKKKMFLEACLHQCQQFLPFITSVGELLCVEASDTLKRIASRLATKWRHPYFRTYIYVKSMVAITLIRTTHQCIRGSKVPVQY